MFGKKKKTTDASNVSNSNAKAESNTSAKNSSAKASTKNCGTKVNSKSSACHNTKACN